MRGRKKVEALTTRQDLVKIKAKALRARLWFRALSKVERAILDLTIKCVEKVRSTVLAGVISMIVGKILQSLEEGFILQAERIGHEIVERICRVSERWGNKKCSTWRCDKCFIKFLGVNTLNALNL